MFDIVTPQFERTDKKVIKPPSSVDSFNKIVSSSALVLKQEGFGLWDSMNRIIEENIENAKISIFHKNDSIPLTLLEKDENIFLFPKEWYNIIPEGFIVTGLYGEKYAFEKAIASDDIRFGCLAFGITKPIEDKV